jgi:polyisoprenoid-binding protein YceI
MSAYASTTEPLIPTGTWNVDPSAGELTFKARGMFGLATVRGTFSRYEGQLETTERGSTGELRIAAESLDTRNATRDKHLRSADFFDAERHPTVAFTLSEISGSGLDGAEMRGELRIRENRLAISAPVQVERLEDDRVRLSADISVDRAAAGVGWNRLGMIRGDAHLRAVIVLQNS